MALCLFSRPLFIQSLADLVPVRACLHLTPSLLVQGRGLHVGLACRRDFWFNCFGMPCLPVCLFVYFLHTSREGLQSLLMRQRQSENEDRATVAALAGRLVRSAVNMLSCQAGWGKEAVAYRAPTSSRRKKQDSLLLRGTGFSSTSKNSPGGTWSVQGTRKTECNSNPGSTLKHVQRWVLFDCHSQSSDYGGWSQARARHSWRAGPAAPT